jgi:hypothetical protein
MQNNYFRSRAARVHRADRRGPGARLPSMAATLTPPAETEQSLLGEQRPSKNPALRRFTVAVTVGTLLVSVPYLWVLWAQWNPGPSFLRTVAPGNFYDLQARAMLSGHLSIPKGALGIEAFVHDGRQYTYFGIFPSLLRMPILIFTHSLDGRLTAPSILLAWVVTAVFSCVLLWRLRIMVRGEAALGWAEAVSYGVFVAAIAGGSVLVTLAATPWVYDEDFAWSVALTLASVFALLGVLERPSWKRVLGAGVLILFANLNRAPTGYACVIGAGLVAGWFALGRGGEENRRWFPPMLGVAVVPFAASCVVTYAKFGTPVGLPMADQVWAGLNAHRRYFLAANGGKAFSPAFIPTTVTAYFQPFGIRFTGLFPFITNPTTLPNIYGAVFDQTYQTASIPATMPLLFLLACWGVLTAFRPKPVGRLAVTRLLLLAALSGTAGVLMWGYIADRYMADFMPFLILAGAIGLIDLWRRAETRGRRSGRYLLGGVTVLAVFSILANVATALEPNPQWTTYQFQQYLTAQEGLSLHPVAGSIRHGATLPYYAPAGQMFEVGNCSGLYYSTGETYATVPGQQIQHLTWKPVVQPADDNHTIALTIHDPAALARPVPVLTFGKSALVVERAGPGLAHLRVVNAGASNIPWPPTTGWTFPNTRGFTIWIDVMTDPNLHSIVVSYFGSYGIGHYLPGHGPAVVQVTRTKDGGPPPAVAISDVSARAQAAFPADPSALSPNPALCRSLTHS